MPPLFFSFYYIYSFRKIDDSKKEMTMVILLLKFWVTQNVCNGVRTWEMGGARNIKWQFEMTCTLVDNSYLHLI